MPWSLVFSVFVLIKTHSDWHKFFSIVFMLAIVALCFQVAHILLGRLPATFFGSGFIRVDGSYSIDISTRLAENYIDAPVRALSSPYIVLTAFMGSLVYLSFRRAEFNNRYLFIIILVTLASVFLTATRGWIISISLVFCLYFFFLFPRPQRALGVMVPGMIIMLIVNLLPVLQNQIIGTSNRLLTIEQLAKGDYSAGGTVERYTEYTPQLLKLWKESPILGLAFSEKYWTSQNGHAGHANLLMNVGVMGFMLFVYLWAMLVITPWLIYRRLHIDNNFKKSVLVLILWFLFFMIVHSTSGQQFRYVADFGGGAFGQAIFFVFSEYLLSKAQATDQLIRNNRLQQTQSPYINYK
jgi:hypothetical protein